MESDSEQSESTQSNIARQQHNIQNDDIDDAMNMTVNALLGESIDSYAWRFQTLHESQQTIGAQLEVIIKRLEKYNEEIKDSNRINHTIEKTQIIKKRLKSINSNLLETKKRLDSIKLI